MISIAIEVKTRDQIYLSQVSLKVSSEIILSVRTLILNALIAIFLLVTNSEAMKGLTSKARILIADLLFLMVAIRIIITLPNSSLKLLRYSKSNFLAVVNSSRLPAAEKI